LLAVLIVFPVALLLPGCSAYMAMQQPEKKNLSVLEPGTPRTVVIGTLGVPEGSHIEQGARVDLFHFKEGYAREVKILRATFHVTADAFTFGLWEPFGILFEHWAGGAEIRLRVHYDDQDRVKTFDILSESNRLLVKAPAAIPPAVAEVPQSPSVTPVLMPQFITAFPRRLAVILPQQSPTASFVSSGLDLTLAYLRTFHPAMTIVERAGLEPVTQELILQHTGKVEDDTTVRIGGWKGADALLLVRIEQTSADRLQNVAQRGGEVAHAVEIRLAQVETGLLLFRQTAVATIQVPAPRSDQAWPDEVVETAQRRTLRAAYTYVLAALAASFGDNPLGLIPDVSTRGEGIRLLGVLHGSPSHLAGLRQDDLILETDGKPYVSVTQRLLLPVTLLVERDGARKSVRVEAHSGGQ
jgi:hypothetical protein